MAVPAGGILDFDLESAETPHDVLRDEGSGPGSRSAMGQGSRTSGPGNSRHTDGESRGAAYLARGDDAQGESQRPLPGLFPSGRRISMPSRDRQESAGAPHVRNSPASNGSSSPTDDRAVTPVLQPPHVNEERPPQAPRTYESRSRPHTRESRPSSRESRPRTASEERRREVQEQVLAFRERMMARAPSIASIAAARGEPRLPFQFTTPRTPAGVPGGLPFQMPPGIQTNMRSGTPQALPTLGPMTMGSGPPVQPTFPHSGGPRPKQPSEGMRAFQAAALLRMATQRRTSLSRDDISDGGSVAKGMTAAARAAQRRLERRALRTVGSFLLRFIRFVRARLDRERSIVRRRLIEIVVYMVFLILFSLVVLQFQDQDIFHQGNSIRDQLVGNEFPQADAYVKKTFEDVSTFEDLWIWTHGVFHTLLYNSADTVWGDRAPTNSSSDPYPGFIFGVNRIIGGVRIGTLRVRSTQAECGTLLALIDATASGRFPCFGDDSPDWDSTYEDSQPYGVGGVQFLWEGWNGTSTSDERADSSMFGAYRSPTSRTYPTPAFSVVLPNPSSPGASASAKSILQAMQDGGYLDLQTRLVVMEFTVFNVLTDMFTLFTVTFEVPRAGGVIGRAYMNTIRLYTLLESRDTTMIVIESIVMAFFAWYSLEEIIKRCRYGADRLLSVGALFHNLNLLVFWVLMVFRIVAYVSLPSNIVIDSNQFYNLREAAMYRYVAVLLQSVNGFLAWFKAVVYVSYIPQFRLLTATLSHASKGIFAFMIIFAIVLYGFAAGFLVAFGSHSSNFRNMTTSTFSLLRSLLGDFDFVELRESQWFMGPLFFVIFVGLAVLVILNLIIAIISTAYEEAAQEMSMNAEENKIATQMAHHAWGIVTRIPLIGRYLDSSTRHVYELHQQRLRTRAEELCAVPISNTLPRQPWERVRLIRFNKAKEHRRRQSAQAGNAMASLLVPRGAKAGSVIGEVMDVGPSAVQVKSASPKTGGAEQPRDVASAGTPDNTGAAGKGDDDESKGGARVAPDRVGPMESIVSMVAPPEERQPCCSCRTCCPTWHACWVHRCTRGTVESRVRSIVTVDPTDPTATDITTQGGAFQTPLSREIAARIAVKRHILGENEYQTIVRDRMQQCVDALCRPEWSNLAIRMAQSRVDGHLQNEKLLPRQASASSSSSSSSDGTTGLIVGGVRHRSNNNASMGRGRTGSNGAPSHHEIDVTSLPDVIAHRADLAEPKGEGAAAAANGGRDTKDE